MASQLSQDSAVPSQPSTPEPPHATLPSTVSAATSKLQTSRIESATRQMTPPPSTQIPLQQGKARTPTPPISHISTPPPTVETASQTQGERAARNALGALTSEQVAAASPDELRGLVSELQAALGEARMSAAHHKLQHRMLAQESAAAIERMAVEARMAQYEHEVLHSAEHARANAPTPATLSSPLPEGAIPVQKGLYQRMCREISALTDERYDLARELAARDRQLNEHEYQIERLNDTVQLLRERIRENREHTRSQRRPAQLLDATPRSTDYATQLHHGAAPHEQPQPFEALLQASEMASQEARRPATSSSSHRSKSHARNIHSLSSLPVTPSRGRPLPPAAYQTPNGRHAPHRVPATAPVSRGDGAPYTPGVYAHPLLPVPRGPGSDGTVSASEHGDAGYNPDDSEAETDIVDPDALDASESQAPRAAAQMLRPLLSHPPHSQPHLFSQQLQHGASGDARESLQGRGLLLREPLTRAPEPPRQQQLFGAVRKANGARARGDELADDDLPAAKRPRVGAAPAQGVGLGIQGVRP